MLLTQHPMTKYYTVSHITPKINPYNLNHCTFYSRLITTFSSTSFYVVSLVNLSSIEQKSFRKNSISDVLLSLLMSTCCNIALRKPNHYGTRNLYQVYFSLNCFFAPMCLYLCFCDDCLATVFWNHFIQIIHYLVDFLHSVVCGLFQFIAISVNYQSPVVLPIGNSSHGLSLHLF